MTSVFRGSFECFYVILGDELTVYRLRKKFRKLTSLNFLLDENDIHYEIKNETLVITPISACARYFSWRLMNMQIPEFEEELFKVGNGSDHEIRT